MNRHPSPQICVDSSDRDGDFLDILDALLDTEAEATIVGSSHLDLLDIHPHNLDDAYDLKVMNADDAAILCWGTIYVCLRWDSRSIHETVYICDGVSTPCIAGYLLNDLNWCSCGHST